MTQNKRTNSFHRKTEGKSFSSQNKRTHYLTSFEMAVAEGRSGPLFQSLHGDVEELETMEIESLCVACEENGITKLLLTKIPFYKDVSDSPWSPFIRRQS